MGEVPKKHRFHYYNALILDDLGVAPFSPYVDFKPLKVAHEDVWAGESGVEAVIMISKMGAWNNFWRDVKSTNFWTDVKSTLTL